jgi:Uma2 family endonuclease
MATTHAKNKTINGPVENGGAPLLSRTARPSRPRPVRWTFEQYQKMGELGWFDDKRVELIGGEIFEKFPEEPPYPRPWRCTHKQYHKMAGLGWFEGRRVELIGGEITEIAPMLSPHWATVGLTAQAIGQVFVQNYIVTVQLPLKLPRISEPEPDVAVVRGTWRDYNENLPTTAVLVVEISDTTLRRDRTDKASLYTSAGIEDYWIVNLKAQQVEIYRTPIESKKAKFGWDYKGKTTYKKEDTISPLAAPKAKIKVADLLP